MISEKKIRIPFFIYISKCSSSVVVRRTSLLVCGFFWNEFDEKACGRRNNSSKQHYNSVIVQRCRESKIVILSAKGQTANPCNRVISSCHERKCYTMASFWYMSPESGTAAFRETQRAVSEVY